MIFYKTGDEIELLKLSNELVSRTLAYIASELKVGVTGKHIDKLAEEFIRDNGGIPTFKGYRNFSASLCMSLNDAVVHGIPSDKEFVETDLISIDCGVTLNGFVGDAAFTFLFHKASTEALYLCERTRESLSLGIQKACMGNRIGDISYEIQHFCEKVHGYGIVRELVGHGVGRSLHEKPDVPNFGFKGKGPVIKEGLVIAIEPMVTLGNRAVKQLEDGWTIVTRDGKFSAHYEHSIAVTKDGPKILSNHQIIDNEIKKNENLMVISSKS
jgi:methionyl aminopeptidase